MLGGYSNVPAYYPCSNCPYGEQEQYQAQPYTGDQYAEGSESLNKEEEDDNMFRQPPFFRPPFYGPRPFFRPPFYGPRPFYGPSPFFGPRPFYGPPFGRPGFLGLPFLSGLALGGLLF